MSELKLQVTQEGHLTIPPEALAVQGIGASDYVVLRFLPGGIVLTRDSSTIQIETTTVLRYLVMSLGKQAEQQGIADDEELDDVIDMVQQEIFQERYGATNC